MAIVVVEEDFEDDAVDERRGLRAQRPVFLDAGAVGMKGEDLPVVSLGDPLLIRRDLVKGGYALRVLQQRFQLSANGRVSGLHRSNPRKLFVLEHRIGADQGVAVLKALHAAHELYADSLQYRIKLHAFGTSRLALLPGRS